MKPKISVEKGLYIFGIVLFFLALFAAILYYTGILVPLLHKVAPCSFHALTGFYCPGCGGTRATLSLLQFNIIESFLYHPIVPYCALIYVLFMGSHTIAYLTKQKGIFGICKKGMAYRDLYIYLAIVILLLNFILRNAIYFFWHISYLE